MMKKRELEQRQDVVVRQDATEVRVLSIDQRTAERLPLSLEVSYSIRLLDEQMTGRATTTVISGMGIEFSISHMISPLSPCEVTLALPGHSGSLTLIGQIGWCRQNRGARARAYVVGVTFSPTNNEVVFARYCHFIAAELLKRYLQ